MFLWQSNRMFLCLSLFNLSFFSQFALVPSYTSHWSVTFKLTVYSFKNLFVALCRVENQISNKLANVHFKLSNSCLTEKIHYKLKTCLFLKLYTFLHLTHLIHLLHLLHLACELCLIHNIDILYISYNWKYITITFCYIFSHYLFLLPFVTLVAHCILLYCVTTFASGDGGYTLLQAGIVHRKTENPSSRMCLLYNIFSKIPLLVNNFRLCSLYLATIVRPLKILFFQIRVVAKYYT